MLLFCCLVMITQSRLLTQDAKREESSRIAKATFKSKPESEQIMQNYRKWRNTENSDKNQSRRS